MSKSSIIEYLKKKAYLNSSGLRFKVKALNEAAVSWSSLTQWQEYSSKTLNQKALVACTHMYIYRNLIFKTSMRDKFDEGRDAMIRCKTAHGWHPCENGREKKTTGHWNVLGGEKLRGPA